MRRAVLEVLSEAELGIALGYAPAAIRPALRALFGLDGRLGAIVAATREPQLGLIRLKWWDEALAQLPSLDAGGSEPLLAELATVVRHHDVRSETLSRLTDGWAELFAPFPLDDAALRAFAKNRGGSLFAAAAAIAGEDEDLARRAGEAWALYDLAAHVSDHATEQAARRLADAIRVRPLSRRLASFAILTAWARSDAGGPFSPRRRALIAMRIALIGR